LISIASLYVYPVKSCAGIAVERARVDTPGLVHDREWMIVTPAGRFLTQRELPRLALIRTRLDEGVLELGAPEAGPIQVPWDVDGARTDVRVWQDRCTAIDCGEQPAGWLSRILGREVRLVRFAPTERRPSAREWTGDAEGLSRFADAFALLTISLASLEDLNARLDVPLPMNRFRPNLVLAGSAAYDEDRMHELTAGTVRLRAVKPCTRCAITTTDQSTGTVDGVEPLRTLKTYRWSNELRGVMFGQNLIVLEPGELAVGQALDVSWRQAT